MSFTGAPFFLSGVSKPASQRPYSDFLPSPTGNPSHQPGTAAQKICCFPKPPASHSTPQFPSFSELRLLSLLSGCQPPSLLMTLMLSTPSSTTMDKLVCDTERSLHFSGTCISSLKLKTELHDFPGFCLFEHITVLLISPPSFASGSSMPPPLPWRILPSSVPLSNTLIVFSVPLHHLFLYHSHFLIRSGSFMNWRSCFLGSLMISPCTYMNSSQLSIIPRDEITTSQSA